MSRTPRRPTEIYARAYVAMLRNAKLVDRSHLAWRLYVSSILWCRDHGNDGEVPTGALLVCVPGETKRKLQGAADELIDAGLWELNGAGWIVHDYGQYQDGSERIAANRNRARVAAGARWGDEPDP